MRKLLLLYINHFIRGLPVYPDGLVIIAVVLQIRNIPRLHLGGSFGQIVDDGARRGRHYLITVLYRQVKHASEIIIGIVAYPDGYITWRQRGYEDAGRRSHYLVTSVVRLIEDACIVMILHIIDHHHRSGSRQGAEEKSYGMPCRSIYIGSVWVIIIAVIGVIMMPFPMMRRTGIGWTMGIPARGAMTDRWAGLMMWRPMIGSRRRTTGLCRDYRWEGYGQHQG